MSQNSTTIQSTGTLSGLALVNALNDALDTIATNEAGAGDPGAIGANRFWNDTANGVLKQRNAADTAWMLRASLAETLLVARSANTILAASDFQRTIAVTGTWTQTFNACATLGDGWYVTFKNEGTGTITFDPNGAETIDGAATVALLPGESCKVECDGTQLKTMGRSIAKRSKVIVSTRNMTAASGSVAYTGAGFTPRKITAYAGVSSTRPQSVGVGDVANMMAVSTGSTAAADSIVATSLIYLASTTAGAVQYAGIASMDANGFTLNWTKYGTTAAGTADLTFFCEE